MRLPDVGGVGRRRFEGALRGGDGSEAINLQDGFVITLNPVDGQVLQEQGLLRQATTDPITGLSSRAAILDRLQARLVGGRAATSTTSRASTTATAMPPAIWCSPPRPIASERPSIRTTIGQNRTSHLRGDACLVIPDDMPSLGTVMVVAETLQKATATTIPYGDGLIEVSLPFGVALHGAAEEADLFVRRVDRALVDAKAAGSNQALAL